MALIVRLMLHSRPGFNLTKHNTFDDIRLWWYWPNPRIGIPVAHDVQPEDVLYYVKAMLMVFANHGNFKNRGKARTPLHVC